MTGPISPKNTPPKHAPSDARVGGMVATVALAVMFGMVGLFVWMGS